jgi:hypothetical protein
LSIKDAICLNNFAVQRRRDIKNSYNSCDLPSYIRGLIYTRTNSANYTVRGKAQPRRSYLYIWFRIPSDSCKRVRRYVTVNVYPAVFIYKTSRNTCLFCFNFVFITYLVFSKLYQSLAGTCLNTEHCFDVLE